MTIWRVKARSLEIAVFYLNVSYRNVFLSLYVKIVKEQSFASTSTSVGLVSLDNDPVYSEINRRLNEGCSCAVACLTQFNTDEIYRFCLSLYGMTKSEKEMLILGKLHAISKSSDSIQHARQSKPGKRKRVTCGHCFDDRLVCKDGLSVLA